MILKKCLIRGQASFEYFLLFTAIIAISLLSFSVFYPQIRTIVQGDGVTSGYFGNVAKGLIEADLRDF
jgi:uncharacterized protein (UPF0333 family)